jgi:hypothetical protein
MNKKTFEEYEVYRYAKLHGQILAQDENHKETLYNKLDQKI